MAHPPVEKGVKPLTSSSLCARSSDIFFQNVNPQARKDRNIFSAKFFAKFLVC